VTVNQHRGGRHFGPRLARIGRVIYCREEDQARGFDGARQPRQRRLESERRDLLDDFVCIGVNH
jgi:hypothetical protein